MLGSGSPTLGKIWLTTISVASSQCLDLLNSVLLLIPCLQFILIKKNPTSANGIIGVLNYLNSKNTSEKSDKIGAKSKTTR